MNEQPTFQYAAQQLQTVISIVVGLAFMAMVIADAVKALKGALKG